MLLWKLFYIYFKIITYLLFMELANMLRDGNIMNLPNLMPEDVWGANELYGNSRVCEG
jgi:hypothetical protein